MKRFTRRSLFLLLTAALCLLLAGCWGSDPLAEENGDLNGRTLFDSHFHPQKTG